MHVINVTLKLKPEAVEPFLKEVARHKGEIAAHEPGCLQFDVAQDKTDPLVYIFYEVYADDAALERHSKSESLKQWFAASKDWAVARTVHHAVRKSTLR